MREELGGTATTQNILDRGNISGCLLCSCAGLSYRISQIVTKWRQLWTGPSAWSQLIGLISDDADVNSALWGLDLIDMQYRRTSGPAKRKDHARERVSSSDLESPLVHDCL